MGAWASLALMLNSGIRRSFFPVYAAVRLGLTPASIGLLMSAYAVASMAVRPFLGWMAKEWGTVRVLGVSLLLGAAAWALVPATDSIAFIFVLMILGGVGVGMGSPLTMVLTVEGVPLYERGLGLGIRQAANRIADFASAPLYGAAAGMVGLPATFFVAAGFALAGLAGMLRIRARDETTVAALSDEGRP
jgi:MFS family permease